MVKLSSTVFCHGRTRLGNSSAPALEAARRRQKDMLYEHFGIFGRVKLSRMSSEAGGPLIALARMAKTCVCWYISVSVDELTGPSRYRFNDAEKQYWLTAALTAGVRFR